MEIFSQEQVMNRAARRHARRRIGGLAGMSLVATTGLLGTYLGNPRIPRAYAAATCTVTTSADSGAGSLRQALLDHDALDANCSTINFASSVTTITLSADLLKVVGSSLTITGPGSNLLTVNLNNKSGIKLQSASAGQTLSISGLTFTGGYSGGYGGAVYARDVNTEISDVTFTSNSSYGGALYVTNGALNITNSSFTNNSSYYAGGAVSVKLAGLVNITGSTFTGNSSGNSNNGGAVNVDGNDVSVTSSTFSANTASGYGGAINASGALTLSNSTFTGNSARAGGGVVAGSVTATSTTFSTNTTTSSNGYGGAIRSSGAVTLNNSSFTGNSAFAGGGVVAGSVTATSTTFSQNQATYLAGAIVATTAGVSLTNSTLTGNLAYFNAGAFSIGNFTANFTTFSGNISSGSALTSSGMIASTGAYTVSNSIFNETGLAIDTVDSGSTATFSFFNGRSALENDTGAGLIFATTAGVAPLNLGALANNGGTTLTMLPGAGSPVIGAANPASTTPTVDQRGVTRTSPSTMGAVHVAFTPAPAPAPDPDPTPAPTVTPTATPTPTPTPTTSVAPVVVPVVVPVVTRPVVVTPVVLANAGVSLLPAAQRGDAQVVEVAAPASTSVANAPEVSVSAGTAVAPVVGGLPPNRPIFAALRILRSGSLTTTSLLRAKSSFVPMGTTRSTAAGRVKVPAFKATRPGVYTIRLSTAEGTAYYVKVKVTAKKSTKP